MIDRLPSSPRAVAVARLRRDPRITARVVHEMKLNGADRVRAGRVEQLQTQANLLAVATAPQADTGRPSVAVPATRNDRRVSGLPTKPGRAAPTAS